MPKGTCPGRPQIRLYYLPEFGELCFAPERVFCCAASVLPEDTWADTVSVPLSMTANRKREPEFWDPACCAGWLSGRRAAPPPAGRP